MRQQEQLQQNASTTVADTEHLSEFLQTRPFAPVAKSHSSSSTQRIQPKADSSSGFGHSFGNLAVLPLTKSVIQPKLTIGQPGDKYEQEADRLAVDVVQRINQPKAVSPKQKQTVQRQEVPEEEEELQMKPLAHSIQRMEAPEEEQLQMKPLVQRREAADKEQASTDLESSINSARGGGQPLSPTLKEPMEQAFGADFSGVRVHTDTQADILSRSIQAKAFTTGQDLFFRQGAYEPGSRGGQELLAHELTHVVQQNGSAVQQKLSKKVEETELNIQANNEKLETISKENEVDIKDKNEKLETIPKENEVDIEDENEELETIPKNEVDIEDENEEDIKANNEQEQPKQDSEPVNSQKDPGKVTIDNNLKRASKYYKAIEINTLDFEKKYYAFLEDQELLEIISQFLADAPDKAKDPKYVDQVIKELKASRKDKSEEEEKKINQKIVHLEEAKPYLESLGNDKEQPITVKWVDYTGQSWKEAQKSQLFVGFVYDKIQEYRKDYSKWSGNIKTKSLSETEQKEKVEAKAMTKVMADEAELHFDEIERRSGHIKTRKKELIKQKRLLPEFADDWKKWCAAKGPTKLLEVMLDTIAGTATLGLVRFQFDTNARGKVNPKAKRTHWKENFTSLKSLRETANSIVREFKVIQTLKKDDSAFVDKVVTGLQFLEMFLENVKRVCRYTSLACSFWSLVPLFAPILGPVAAITGIISVMTSAARVPVNLLIAMIRGLQVVANDAKLSNAMQASATKGAVKSLGAAISLGSNIASDYATSEIENEKYHPINSNSPSVIKDSVQELQNGGDKDSESESLDMQVKSYSTKKGINVAANAVKNLGVEELAKNKHKPYKLFGSVNKGDIEGPLSDKASKHEKDVSYLYTEMLVNRQAKVTELTTQLLDKLRPIQEKNASVSTSLANATKVASSEKAQEQDKSPEDQISQEDTNVLNESQVSFDESLAAWPEVEKGLQGVSF